MPRPKIPDRLNAGEVLEHNQFLQSPNGKYRLRLKWTPDRSTIFGLYDGETALWSVYTGLGTMISMTKDCNLLIKNSVDWLSWESGTRSPVSDPNGYVQVLDEGIAIVKAAEIVRWSTHPDKIPATVAVSKEWTTSAKSGGNKLDAGEALLPGLALSSPNGQYTAILRETGELQVIKKSTAFMISTFKVTDKPLSKLCLGYNSYFHAIDTEGKVVASFDLLIPVNPKKIRSGGNPGPIVLRDDGNLGRDFGTNYGWQRPLYKDFHTLNPWSNRLWLPASIGQIESLSPGQRLIPEHTMQRVRAMDKAEIKAGFTSGGDIFVTRGSKTTYYYTGATKDSGDAQFLSFTHDELSLLGVGDKVLWSVKYEEPYGFQARYDEQETPPKLLLNSYGDLIILYKDAVLWNSDSLKQGDQPTA